MYIKCVIGAAQSKVMMIVVRLGDYSLLRCSAYCSSGEDVKKRREKITHLYNIIFDSIRIIWYRERVIVQHHRM